MRNLITYRSVTAPNLSNKIERTLALPGYAFWDVQKGTLDMLRDRAFIISRMFERATLEDVLSLIAFYGQDTTGLILQQNKYLNRQGLFLAHALLGLPLQNFNAYRQLHVP